MEHQADLTHPRFDCVQMVEDSKIFLLMCCPRICLAEENGTILKCIQK